MVVEEKNLFCTRQSKSRNKFTFRRSTIKLDLYLYSLRWVYDITHTLDHDQHHVMSCGVSFQFPLTINQSHSTCFTHTNRLLSRYIIRLINGMSKSKFIPSNIHQHLTLANGPIDGRHTNCRTASS